MRQYRDWLFTKGAVEAPQEYVDYLMCAHVYHCTPVELDEQPAMIVGLHLDFFNEELQQRGGKKRVMRGKVKRLGNQYARNPH